MIQSNILLTDIVIPTVDNLIVTDVQDEVIIKDSDIMSTTLTIASLNSEFIPQESQTSPSLLDLNTTEFNNLSNEIVVTPTIQNNGMLLNTDIPVYDNAVPTDLSLNTNSPSNNDVLGSYESVNAIPSITPGSGSLFPSDPAELPQINSLFELLQYLSEIMMRFNSDPNYYMQDDFAILVKTITNALIHLYLNAPLSTGEVEGLYAALGTKVDKILGKGLSTNDLTDELKAAYDQAFLETHIHNNKSALDLVSGENTGDQDLSGLQPKETGKGLSTNDFTNLDRTKLDGIQAGAEANVNADWNATSGDALILNKPNIPDITGLASETYVQNYAEPKKGTDDNYVTDIEKANLHAPHSDDQDLSGLVVKIPGYSLVADVEIAKIHLPGSDNQDLTPYETIANNNIKLATKEPANPNIQAHIANTNNPHLTTKAQVGLSAVDNTSDLSKPISIATQNALDTKEPNITLGTVSQYWRGDKTFQTLDKNAVGLDQVDNTSDINKPISTSTQTALDNKEDLITAGLITDYWRGDKTFQPLDKAAVGLGNVDNTSDLLKPISTATQNALDLKLDTSLKGANNGLAELDSNGFVKNTQLPSYVDDVLEFTSISLFPSVGESGKIYIDTTTNLTYRWGGTTYAIISSSLALGETSATAYRGDRGKIAYDHSQINSGNPHGLTLLDIGAQAQLNGTGLVRMSGTSVTYDNTSYVSGTPWTSVGYWYSGSHPTTTSGYGLPDYPTTLPASDVYSWAKASTKPSYVWTEIGSRPTNLSQFTNDLGNYGGWITGYTETDTFASVTGRSNISATKLGVNLIYGGGLVSPTISLAIGDYDTGFNGESDGTTGYYSNGTKIYNLADVWRSNNFNPASKSDISHTHDYATHRGEGTNYIDNSYRLYDNYRGGWRTSDDLYVSYSTSSSKLYSTDSSYAYGTGSAYYGYLTYNGTANRWRFKVSPATPDSVEVAYADLSGTMSGGIVTGNSWFTYGQNSNSNYSWVNAALTTNSIELVTNVNNSGGHPTLAFHTWGTGGAQFRMSNDNVLHIESAYANSARVAASSGTSYFDYLDIYSRSAVGIYINGNGVVHDGNIGRYTPYQSNRDFASGTLIKTDIDYSHTEGEPFLLEIVGNSYNMTTPFDIKVQGYIYANQIIAYGGISNGANFPNITVINVDGFLCFWFPRLNYWQGFTVNVNSSYSGNKKNRLVSISDSVKPANATKEIVVTIYQSYHSGNRSFVSKTGDTMSGTLDMQNNTLSNVDTIQHANARIIMHGNLHIDSYNGNAIYNQYYSHADIQNFGHTRNNGYGITGVGTMDCSNVQVSNAVYFNGTANYWNFTSNAIHSNGDVHVDGNVTASNFILSSDRTLKTNIQPITKDYSSLNLVSFNFKNNLDELRFGTIAQDLLSNGYSEFVTGDKEGEYKVKYIDLIIAKLASAELRIKELEDKYGSR